MDSDYLKLPEQYCVSFSAEEELSISIGRLCVLDVRKDNALCFLATESVFQHVTRVITEHFIVSIPVLHFDLIQQLCVSTSLGLKAGSQN